MRVFPFEGGYMLCSVNTSLCYHTLNIPKHCMFMTILSLIHI